MSLIRGVLLAGKFRTHRDLNSMSREDQRNTLIVELTNHSNQTDYQSYDDAALAGMGAVMVFLRECGLRDDQALRTMSADDQRNTLIVEIDGQTRQGSALQGLSNMDLVLVGLGMHNFWIRGVLLAGKFRSHHDLNGMSREDQRNTLIVELTNHSNQTNYQAYDDSSLAAAGAVMVFLRECGLRDDQALRTMSSDDQRNTLIVEIDGQTHQGSNLQGLNNMDLVRVGLGAYPSDSVRQLMAAPLDVLRPEKTEETASGMFHSEGPVWFISLSNNDTVALATFLESGGASVGAAVGVAIAAGGAAAFGPLWPGIMAALSTAGHYILAINRFGGHNGVDINGVVGTLGLIVTPRRGLPSELVKAARLQVSGRTILDFVLLASSRIPALAAVLDLPVAAGIFGAVAAGTPLGLAIATGLGLVVHGLQHPPDPDEHGAVHADRDRAQSWETFLLAQVGERNKVGLLSWQGLFSAIGGGGSGVYANRPAVKDWETWTLIENGDGTVSFQTANGHFLVAEGGGGRECQADRTAIGPWEKFVIVNLPDGKIALKTHDQGKFVSVQQDS